MTPSNYSLWVASRDLFLKPKPLQGDALYSAEIINFKRDVRALGYTFKSSDGQI